jgi:hypothetical protein
MRRVGGVFSQYENRDAEIAKEAIAMNRRTFLGTTAAALASGGYVFPAEADRFTTIALSLTKGSGTIVRNSPKPYSRSAEH